METQLQSSETATETPSSGHNDTEFDTGQEIIKRLRKTIPAIEEVRKIVRVPSISSGVLHQGKIIFTGSVGSVNDVQIPDEDTLYHLGSVSKCFVFALVGIAVEEGKVGWKDLVSTHLTDFDPIDDPKMKNKFEYWIAFDIYLKSAAAGSLLCLVHAAI